MDSGSLCSPQWPKKGLILTTCILDGLSNAYQWAWRISGVMWLSVDKANPTDGFPYWLPNCMLSFLLKHVLFVCLFCHFINWRIFALQNFVVFCHTSRISHRCIYVSSLPNLPSSKHVLTAQLTYSVRSVSDQNRRLVTMFPKEWTKLVRAPGLKIIKHCFSMSLMVMIARADLVCMLTFSQGPLTKPHEKSKNLWT